MLTRLYVDNYRCLVNFEFKPKQVQLIVGLNGAGKSSVFDALEALRLIAVEGAPLDSVLGLSTRTDWQYGRPQSFEIESRMGAEVSTYKLVVEHGGVLSTARVREEMLAAGGNVFYHSKDGELANDDPRKLNSSIEVKTDRSGLPLHVFGPDYSFLESLVVARINPWAMNSRSERAAPRPKSDLSNLGDWFRHLAQEGPAGASSAVKALSQVIPGLDEIVATEAGMDVRVVQAKFRRPGGSAFAIPLTQISDGQRALAALYLLTTVLESRGTLLVDEPENFVALAEIQPWLMEAKDRAEESGGQLIIASHHPEILNQLAHDALILERDDAGPTRIVPFPPNDTGLTPAEIVARGWESA